VASQKKEEASEMFKNNKLEEAIKLFSECIALDPLNLTYNSTLLLNKAIALVKLGNNDQALKELNQCLRFNPQYAKALVKRGEVHVTLEHYEEAVQDFGSA
jgi:DnaJ family protein C protein 7